jgi:hypothetical protein
MNSQQLTLVVALIQATGALLAAAAAVLAWIAKIRWADEFKAAKEAEIQSLKTRIQELKATKDEQIAVYKSHVETLRQLDSTTLREHYISQREGFEEPVDELEQSVAEYERQLDEATQLINGLRSEKRATEAELQETIAARDQLEHQVENLKFLLSRAREPEFKPEPHYVDLAVATGGTASASAVLSETLQRKYPDRDFETPHFRFSVPALVRKIDEDEIYMGGIDISSHTSRSPHGPDLSSARDDETDDQQNEVSHHPD